MKFLCCGLESAPRVNLLLKLTRIGSENIKSAIIDCLVKGYEETEAALLNDVKQQNFNRAMKRLNEIAAIVEDIKEIDYAHINKQKSLGSAV